MYWPACTRPEHSSSGTQHRLHVTRLVRACLDAYAHALGCARMCPVCTHEAAWRAVLCLTVQSGSCCMDLACAGMHSVDSGCCAFLVWHVRSGVPHLQHVPLLPETVRRLLLPPYMATHVQYLKSDRQHGAAELAAYVLQVGSVTDGSWPCAALRAALPVLQTVLQCMHAGCWTTNHLSPAAHKPGARPAGAQISLHGSSECY